MQFFVTIVVVPIWNPYDFKIEKKKYANQNVIKGKKNPPVYCNRKNYVHKIMQLVFSLCPYYLKFLSSFECVRLRMVKLLNGLEPMTLWTLFVSFFSFFLFSFNFSNSILQYSTALNKTHKALIEPQQLFKYSTHRIIIIHALMNAFQSTSKNSFDVSSKSSWVVYGVIFSLMMLVLTKARYFDWKKEKGRNEM